MTKFFIYDNKFYVIFSSAKVDGSQGKSDKFCWSDEHPTGLDVKELHNIVFDGEKHILSGSNLQTFTYKIVWKEKYNDLDDNEGFEMAIASAARTGLPYDLCIDSVGKDRNVSNNSPKVKVGSKGEEVSLLIAARSKVLVGDGKKLEKLSEVMKFIEENYEAFLFHWNKKWYDMAMLDYIKYVTKRGKTKSQAISLLLNDGVIEENCFEGNRVCMIKEKEEAGKMRDWESGDKVC